MGSSWHTMLVHWSITLPLQMHAVLHYRNWHLMYHWYTIIHPKGIHVFKYSNRRLFPTCNWIHNSNNTRPPKENSFLVLRWCNKKCDQSDCSHFTAKYSSALLVKFNISSNVTIDSESEHLAIKHHQLTCTRSEGGTGCTKYEGENTYDSTQITPEGKYFNIP